ncbi:VPLPA-CTERM protein sorting domain-containing protein [Desulfocicer vacuolatum DSM 3385]|uniref:VPLPA-CTERM protein sorting domain-containing protein n=1 Tax=Desulfocicer vacuolatum DSM 3385 TaxID=1121400 RepID=A0A1W1ZNZ3_9BACT|nr:PEP-CTERM sorting domain-containing protein [Desulfocicer vacuolatum]SMC50104.1 VPLPA-CTERM protein sorting domain-containing protein [Desulfocicer vacuolatum DSM 3385]
MKLLFNALLIVFTVCFVSTASGYDYGVNINDNIIWEGDHVGNGGEFTWTLLDDDGKKTDFSWSSFCVETSQRIYANTPYTISDISDTTTSGASLTNEVAWLYWKFNSNTLTGYDGSSTSQMAFQNLIWEDMDQDSNYFSWGTGTAVEDQMDTWFTLAETAVNNGWRNNGRVQVLNLGGAQDQLIVANPVPEPASMCLLGIGLIGLAVMGRKNIFLKN